MKIYNTMPKPIITDLLMGNAFTWLLGRPNPPDHPPPPPAVWRIALQSTYSTLAMYLGTFKSAFHFPTWHCPFFLEYLASNQRINGLYVIKFPAIRMNKWKTPCRSQTLAWGKGDSLHPCYQGTNQEKGGLGSWQKAHLKVKLHGLISYMQSSKYLIQNYF